MINKLYHIKWIYNQKEISYINLWNWLILQENWKVVKEPKNIFKKSIIEIFSWSLHWNVNTILEKDLNKKLEKNITNYLSKKLWYKNIKLIWKEYVTNRWIIDYLYSNNKYTIIIELKTWNIKISDIRQIEWYIKTFKDTNKIIKWYIIGQSNTKNYKTATVEFIQINQI